MMALFLLLSFFLLSTTVLSFFVGNNASDLSSPSQAEKTEGGGTVSFFVCNFIDFLETENFAFKLGLGPAFQTRKTLTERSSQLFGAAILICSFLLLSYSALGKENPPFNLCRITEFLHAKDGMI